MATLINVINPYLFVWNVFVEFWSGREIIRKDSLIRTEIIVFYLP